MQVVKERLKNHLLLDHDFQKPEEIVKRMFCVQSQDFKQHLWSIAVRCKYPIKDIENAYNNGSIIK